MCPSPTRFDKKLNPECEHIVGDMREIQVGKQGKLKVSSQLEELSDKEQQLFEALNLDKIHLKLLKIDGVGVYN